MSRFHQVRQSIANAFAQRSSPSSKSAAAARSNLPTPSPSSLSTQLTSPMPSYNNDTNAYHQRGHHGASSVASTGHTPAPTYAPAAPSLIFKPSPFYRVEAPVSSLRVCEGKLTVLPLPPLTVRVLALLTAALEFAVMTQHRNSISIPFKLSDYPALQRCLSDKTCRVMIFCAGESSGLQDIVFPHQSELKVNGGEIKANLRGLKNKPGSTRPVDVTNALRLKTNHVNSIDFTYALTSKVRRPSLFCCDEGSPIATNPVPCLRVSLTASMTEILPHRQSLQNHLCP